MGILVDSGFRIEFAIERSDLIREIRTDGFLRSQVPTLRDNDLRFAVQGAVASFGAVFRPASEIPM